MCAFPEDVQAKPTPREGPVPVEDLMSGPRLGKLNNNRPVALTSHIIKTLEGVPLRVLRLRVGHAVDPFRGHAWVQEIHSCTCYTVSTPTWMIPVVM